MEIYSSGFNGDETMNITEFISIFKEYVHYFFWIFTLPSYICGKIKEGKDIYVQNRRKNKSL